MGAGKGKRLALLPPPTQNGWWPARTGQSLGYAAGISDLWERRAVPWPGWDASPGPEACGALPNVTFSGELPLPTHQIYALGRFLQRDKMPFKIWVLFS